MQNKTFVGWGSVAIAFGLMLLYFNLVLYPQPDNDNILTALRLSSVTTAVPFLLVFAARPLGKITVFHEMGQWIQINRTYLWSILTISHLLHLHQIWLYYRLEQSCPWIVWAITTPLWLIMVIFWAVEIIKPEAIDRLYTSNRNRGWKLAYFLGNWYIWSIFTLAFALSAMGKHILFYNVPALILFLIVAIARGLIWWRRAIA